MTVQVCVSKKNLEEVIKVIKSSQDAEFDFSGSMLNSSDLIRKVFAAIEYAHPEIKVNFHNCKIDEESLAEFTLCLMTTKNLNHVRITGCPKEMMMAIAFSLCRNHSLESVMLDGVSPASEAVILLGKVINKLTIKDENLLFFNKHESLNGDSLQDQSSIQPKPRK